MTTLLDKYSFWNIITLGGGGGGDSGGKDSEEQRDTSLDKSDTYNAPIGPGLSNSPDIGTPTLNSRGEVTYSGTPTVSETPKETSVDTSVFTNAPPETSIFTTGPVPNSVVPTGAFNVGYPSNNPPDFSGGNSTNAAVVQAALDAGVSVPSPGMAADLAAMGGVPAPGVPMPIARPADVATIDRNGPFSFGGVGQTIGVTSPGGTQENPSTNFNGIPQYQDTSQLLRQIPGVSSSTDTSDPNSAWNKLLQASLGITPAVAADTPPVNVVLPSNVPLPTPRPDDLNSNIINAGGSNIPLPIARPTDLGTDTSTPLTINQLAGVVPLPPPRPADLNGGDIAAKKPIDALDLKASVATPSETQPITPFQQIVKSITEELPKNATNAVVGFVPGVGLVNTASGILGGPTVGSVLFPKDTTTTTTTDETKNEPFTPPSYTDAQLRDLMNQPGWGSEDPSLIADFNKYNTDTYGVKSGPTTKSGEISVGQTTPETMVPKVNPDGSVTMVPTLGSQINTSLEQLFNPFVAIGTQKYADLGGNNAGTVNTTGKTVNTNSTGTTTPIVVDKKSSDVTTPTISTVTTPNTITTPKTTVTTPITTVVTPNTSNYVSSFNRKYTGPGKNVYRYGYGPESSFYTTAAKGGKIGPLNQMRKK
jgi:hypothetical protein